MAVIAALAVAFNCSEALNNILSDVPVAAATKVFVGSIAAVDAAGNLNPASDTAGLHVLGRCEGLTRTYGDSLVGSDADNSGGLAGDLHCNVKAGVFRWLNSVDNPVTKAMIGKPAFVESDCAVNYTGGNNKIVAGTIVDVDSKGVWVDTRRQGARLGVYTPTSAQCATTAAIDLGTSEALANDLKAKYNALQTDFVALLARLG